MCVLYCSINFAALDLLLRLADKPSGNLQGHEKTVLYLQKLGKYSPISSLFLKINGVLLRAIAIFLKSN